MLRLAALMVLLIVVPETEPARWWRIGVENPWFEIPHVLELGRREELEVLVAGEWVRAYRGTRLDAVLMDAGRVLLARGPRLLFREGERSPTHLDREACPGPSATIQVSWDGCTIVCTRIDAALFASRERLTVTTLDVRGRVLRRLSAVSERGDWDAKQGEHGSYNVVGIRADGGIFVAIRLRPTGERTKFVVVALSESDTREVLRAELPSSGGPRASVLDADTRALREAEHLVSFRWNGAHDDDGSPTDQNCSATPDSP